ncbi:MAG: AAA family ATPase [Caldilineaceae bacterium]|nr:AAA family ATPase [Caldilineaceae bacterium]
MTDTLRGVIERVTYHNEENGYTVARLAPERRRAFASDGEITIVGNLPSINVGESVELRGRWTVHGDYGRQFAVETLRTVLPATIAGMEKYLGSGLIKGVGPVTARRIVKHFGLETLEVIEQTPARLNEVPGVGKKRVQMITRAWAEQQAIKEVMIFLQSHDVSTGLATKIYKYYGDDAIRIVQDDPYRLARDIYGIGFLTADKIAQALGIPPDSPRRVAAGVTYALNQSTDNGHVFLPIDELAGQAAELLAVERRQIGIGLLELWREDQVKLVDEPGGEALASPAPALAEETPRLLAEAGTLYAPDTMHTAEALLREKRDVYLTPLFYSETGVANQLARLARPGPSRLATFAANRFNWEAAFFTAGRNNGLELAPQQRVAVQTALTHPLTVLTGGPGTGKTTTVRTILQFCRQAGHRVLLAAPTGRAAKRLAETTEAEAKTIHRLLEFKPADGMSFKRNEESPLDADLLIVDEASMLDLALTNHLLKAIPPGMHLLLVGDVDQLPSVGAGNVLRDVMGAIDGQRLKTEDWKAGTQKEFTRPGDTNLQSSIFNNRPAVIRLNTIFRQAPGSYIITNAHRINKGEMPIIDNEGATDFFVFRTEDPQRAAQLCVELVQERIPRRFGFRPEDIQVLSPMHRGVAGVGALNEAIQATVNPPSAQRAERHFGSRVYRVGDRIMQIRNNYDKEVYNGDMGVIRAVNAIDQELRVEIDGREIAYDFLELDELTHAFAVSVHKSQGSEFPAVVIPVLTSHYMLLQRNLLYTAVTRARQLVVLVGQPRAMRIAVGNDKVTARHTGLDARLLRAMM